MPYGLRVRVPSSAVTKCHTLGNRLMVGHRTLTPFVQVRILSPENILLRDIDAGMVELVDTLGLEPSALRCAGSSPVPGNYY